VPEDALNSLLSSYSINGEGWGVDFEQLQGIFSNAPGLVAVAPFTDADLRYYCNY
jgi:hypothetical protein